jgi:hypothetical protein
MDYVLGHVEIIYRSYHKLWLVLISFRGLPAIIPIWIPWGHNFTPQQRLRAALLLKLNQTPFREDCQ